jgi:hypothetical protein
MLLMFWSGVEAAGLTSAIGINQNILGHLPLAPQQ